MWQATDPLVKLTMELNVDCAKFLEDEYKDNLMKQLNTLKIFRATPHAMP